MNEILDNLGFPKPITIGVRHSIADLFPVSKRCGIYVLGFQNKEYYIGQAIDVTRRYVQHKQTHDDILKIWFKKTRKDLLNEEERNIIWKLEENGFRLRNIALTALPPVESDFDLIVSPEDQILWLKNQSSAEQRPVQRPDYNEIRRKYEKKFKRFLSKPYASEAIRFLKNYVLTTIPFPQQSELSFWCTSCLPAYSNPDASIYSRVNIYWQEVFTVFYDIEGLGFTFHMSKLPLQKYFGSKLIGLVQKYKGIRITDHFYKPGGYDQVNLVADNIKAAERLLCDSVIISSIKDFNLRLMKKGACVFSRYHCFNLADQFFLNGKNSEDSTEQRAMKKIPEIPLVE